MNANQLANASSKNNALFLFLGLMVVAFLLVPDQAHAGTGGTAFDDVWVTLKDWTQGTLGGTVAKLAMRQPFVLFKGLTFQKLCLPGAFRPGDHHNKMLRPGLCVVHASPQYL
ncbi:hypothetical protein MS14393_B00157 (plasmid) [Klebsiella pneumoniae]|nr:hypothetical protein MS14393_B00157 [Klebsiella pneumoniae]